MALTSPHLWSPNAPYLYTLRTTLKSNGQIVDEVVTKVGLRTFKFDVNRGFLVNGEPMKIKGANVHLDHAGVGVAVPDELWVYKVKKLKRIRIMDLTLHGLKPGQYREIELSELGLREEDMEENAGK